jgi:hypothetical protein
MNHERTAGLLDSAGQPQLPGRLLQVADIRPELQVCGCGCVCVCVGVFVGGGGGVEMFVVGLGGVGP